MSGHSDIGPLPRPSSREKLLWHFQFEPLEDDLGASNRSPLPVIPPGSCPMDASVVIENQLTITLLRFR